MRMEVVVAKIILAWCKLAYLCILNDKIHLILAIYLFLKQIIVGGQS
jgi:hypothetical protein